MWNHRMSVTGLPSEFILVREPQVDPGVKRKLHTYFLKLDWHHQRNARLEEGPSGCALQTRRVRFNSALHLGVLRARSSCQPILRAGVPTGLLMPRE